MKTFIYPSESVGNTYMYLFLLIYAVNLSNSQLSKSIWWHWLPSRADILFLLTPVRVAHVNILKIKQNPVRLGVQPLLRRSFL